MKAAMTVCILLALMSSVGCAGGGGMHARENWGAVGSYGSHYDPATVVAVSGVITDVQKVTIGNRHEYYIIMVRVSDGENVKTAYMGPECYWQKHGVSFNTGSHLELTGSDVTINNHPLVVVKDVRVGDTYMRLRNDTGQPL